jgi:hypothetical protein
MKRKKSGRFARGNVGGPGRPKKPASQQVASPAGATHGLDVHAANDVVIHAMELAALSESWRVIIAAHDEAVVRELVAHCVARGRLVPTWVLRKFPPSTTKEPKHGRRRKRDRAE